MTDQLVATPTVSVPLSLIKPNPFQMRTEEDPEAIKEIALSIYRNGLLQIPAAQQSGNSYVLAFGHTRKAAYELLAKQGIPSEQILADPGKFGAMPVRIVKDLDDRKLFELALTENIKRRNLNAIEIAEALQRYMDEFKATSKEAGELFALNEATVRGKVRLLELPKEAKEKLVEGKLSEVDARQLLSLQRVSKAGVADAMQRSEKRGESIEEAVSFVLDHSPGVVDLERAHWPLDMDPKFPRELLPQLPESVKQNREHLLNPPACTKCPFYTKAHGDDFCGLELCFERKETAWALSQLAAASKKTKIPVYQKSDGEFRRLDWYDEWYSPKLWTRKSVDPELRLLIDSRSRGYENLPENVTPVYIGSKRAKVQAKASPLSSYERERRKMSSRKPVVKKFLLDKVVPHFAASLSKMPIVVLQDFAGYAKPYDLPHEGGAREFSSDRKKLQRQVAYYALWRHLPESGLKANDYILSTYRWIAAQATKWGVKLPRSVHQAAADLHKNHLATQKTKKAKGKGKKK